MNNSLQAELRPAMLSWKRYWPAGLAICCGLGFSLAVFFVLRGWESRDIETAFCTEAADRAAVIRNAFETPISLLKSVQAAFNGILERHGLKLKDVAQALRVALCGRPVSPGIYDTLMLVGRDEVVARLDRWV